MIYVQIKEKGNRQNNDRQRERPKQIRIEKEKEQKDRKFHRLYVCQTHRHKGQRSKVNNR